jgi:hypothetical protein
MHAPTNQMDITRSPPQAPIDEDSASYLNDVVLRKLQKALLEDTEVDLESLIPSTYSIRLAAGKTASTSFHTALRKVDI